MNLDIKDMLRFIIKSKSISYVAKRVGVARFTVYRTLNGETSPNYRNGKAIEALYNEVVAEQQKAG